MFTLAVELLWVIGGSSAPWREEAMRGVTRRGLPVCSGSTAADRT